MEPEDASEGMPAPPPNAAKGLAAETFILDGNFGAAEPPLAAEAELTSGGACLPLTATSNSLGPWRVDAAGAGKTESAIGTIPPDRGESPIMGASGDGATAEGLGGGGVFPFPKSLVYSPGPSWLEGSGCGIFGAKLKGEFSSADGLLLKSGAGPRRGL